MCIFAKALCKCRLVAAACHSSSGVRWTPLRPTWPPQAPLPCKACHTPLKAAAAAARLGPLPCTWRPSSELSARSPISPNLPASSIGPVHSGVPVQSADVAACCLNETLPAFPQNLAGICLMPCAASRGLSASIPGFVHSELLKITHGQCTAQTQLHSSNPQKQSSTRSFALEL